eukprot:5833678-Amphidinium_carterae.1
MGQVFTDSDVLASPIDGAIFSNCVFWLEKRTTVVNHGARLQRHQQGKLAFGLWEPARRNPSNPAPFWQALAKVLEKCLSIAVPATSGECVWHVLKKVAGVWMQLQQPNPTSVKNSCSCHFAAPDRRPSRTRWARKKSIR